MAEIWVPGMPVTQGSKRAFHRNGRTMLVEQGGDRLRLWRHAVNDEARRSWKGLPLVGPVSVEMYFRLPKLSTTPKLKRTWPINARSGDVDKLERAVFDALTGVCFKDDAQIARAVVEKDWAGPSGPGVLIYVSQLEGGEPR